MQDLNLTLASHRSMSTMTDVDTDPSIYTVGWISAISTELVAAREFLDREHSRLHSQEPNDSNIYTLGEIAGHNVVIAVLPDGEYGTSSAASVATDMLRTFKNIKIGLMVGVGGGAPSSRDDIRLGDVVVSAPRAGKSGVFQYDYGKTIQGRHLEHTRSLAPPPPLLRAAVNDLKGRIEAYGHNIAEDIQAILNDKPRLRRNYGRPESDSDRLYKSDYIHPDPCLSCVDGCGNGTHHLVHRRQRDEYDDDPTIHYGLIASSNQLMKDALLRDTLVGGHRVLCFEMEAAGLMNHFPCLVIRGVCDYSDTHKNKRWQGYSAMTAAAYTKEILRVIPPARVQAEQSLAMSIHTC